MYRQKVEVNKEVTRKHGEQQGHGVRVCVDGDNDKHLQYLIPPKHRNYLVVIGLCCLSFEDKQKRLMLLFRCRLNRRCYGRRQKEVRVFLSGEVVKRS